MARPWPADGAGRLRAALRAQRSARAICAAQLASLGEQVATAAREWRFLPPRLSRAAASRRAFARAAKPATPTASDSEPDPERVAMRARYAKVASGRATALAGTGWQLSARAVC